MKSGKVLFARQFSSGGKGENHLFLNFRISSNFLDSLKTFWTKVFKICNYYLNFHRNYIVFSNFKKVNMTMKNPKAFPLLEAQGGSN
jgi:hypothetical protein